MAGGVNERVYTPCLPHEEDTGPVTPVCTYNYIGEVLHIYVEAAGATPVNTTVRVSNVAPYELTVNAVVQRPNRETATTAPYFRCRTFSTYPADTFPGVFPMASSMSGFLSNYSLTRFKFRNISAIKASSLA